MSLRTLLNEPLPPMRLHFAQDAREGPAAPEPLGSEQQHRLGRTSSTRDDALSAWQYVLQLGYAENGRVLTAPVTRL